MEKSIHDYALEEMIQLRDLAKQEIKEQYKGVKPFHSDKVDKNELYFHYKQNESPEYLRSLIDRHGVDVVVEFINEMEAMQFDKRRNLL